MPIFGDLFGLPKSPETIIDEWKPRRCTTEKDYENSLVSHWRKIQPKDRVTPQYAVGRTKADIVVNESIIIELKKDLKTTGQRDRLKGQLTNYTEWKGRIIVVLVGDVDLDILSNLRDYASNAGTEGYLPPMLAEDKITVITK